jgi:biotin carboxyl carrier protein
MLVSSLGGPAKAGHLEEGPPEGGHYEQDVVSGFSRTRTTSYDIAFDQGSGSALTVFVNGIAVPLTVVDPRSRWRRGGRDRSDDARPVAVTAPMPGRIVKVLVQPGETVTARQGVVVVEAMKMENELRAPRGGRVAEVRVAEGASVEANTVLVVLE